MRALVVDDSKMVRVILGKSLKELGFEVFEAGHGGEAMAHLRAHGLVDLMLVDWNMPVMNGYELVCAVREVSLLKSIRIMMITTETSLTNVEMALAAGANEYLMKPFTKDQLLEKLALLGLN